MIDFVTAAGNRVWLRPEAVLAAYELSAERDGDGGIVKQGDKLVGILALGGAQFFAFREEGLRFIGALAEATGDAWRLGREDPR